MRKMLIFVFVLFAAAVEVNAQKSQSPTAIPAGATLYIEPHEGFETYVAAAFLKKSVPMVVITEKEKADFILTATTERGDKPSWSQTIFLGKTKSNEDASITIVNAKTKAVHFAYSVHKYNAHHGQQSTAESIAKNVKNKINSRK